MLDTDDNCLANANADQRDFDGDSVGDVCDLCPGTAAAAAVDGSGCSISQVDSDGDGVCNDDAPSLGPPPGCVRSIAVGGVVGLLETDGGEASVSASTDATVGYVVVLAGFVGAALIAGGWFARRRWLR